MNKNKRIIFRLTGTDWIAIEKVAKQEGITISELIRRAAKKYYKERMRRLK